MSADISLLENYPALPDPRIHAWRPDRAAASLRGIVNVPLYVDGKSRQVRIGHAALRKAPSNAATQLSELLFGEGFTVYDDTAGPGWVWGQSEIDGYVGYCWAEVLSGRTPPHTHKVGVPSAFLFPEPDLKTPPLDCLTLGARVTVDEVRGNYVRLFHGGWLYKGGLIAADAWAPDFVGIAESLIGAPYLWGGRTVRGIDCSGLVQLALAAGGISAPRDSDMQEKSLGEAMPASAELRRGDFIFSKGHVAIMASATEIVHANGHYMAVSREPLASLLGRGERITSIRRLPP